ncbi:isoamylase early set domain-containing protein [bacterium]|nr:isoamylase early set domain-containing protein [bacterium]
MSIKKQYLKSKPVCKVTFRIDREQAPEAKTVCLLGEFNHWNPKKNPMKKLKDGSFKLVLDLETGHQYQFRYLVNSSIWENDNAADKYVLNPFGDAENGVVIV